MATTRLKNSILIIFSVLAVLVISLLTYEKLQDMKINKRVTASCKNQISFDIPSVSFAEVHMIDTTKIKVTVRRKGKFLYDILKFESYDKNGDIVRCMLTSSGDHTQMILKQDTIDINFDQNKYLLYGFGSHATKADHGVMRCFETYHMNGQAYSSGNNNVLNETSTPITDKK